MIFINLAWLKRFLLLGRMALFGILLLSFAIFSNIFREEINETDCYSDV